MPLARGGGPFPSCGTFPELWHLVLALPPLGSLTTIGRWAVFHRQDYHSEAQTTYREALLEVLLEEQVAVVLSGHDHNLQLLEIGREGETGSLIQVISGAAAVLDSVTRGPETLAYHGGSGFVRLFVRPGVIFIEMFDHRGMRLGSYRIETPAIGRVTPLLPRAPPRSSVAR